MDVLTKTCFLLLFVGQVLAYSQLVHPNTIAVGSSTYGNYVASRAVDGNTDNDVSLCFHSDDRRGIKDAWLRIDLGGVYSVKSVKFWYRGDRKPTRLRGHSLRVSNDTNIPPVESSCYTDPGNVTLPTIVEEDCERTARYIWIYQNNYHDRDNSPIVEICEVQVFGCEVGYYGRNCTNKCDHCKNSVTCGVQNGECDALGCINDGYQPSLCKACSAGRYGQNCGYTCSGNCENGEACDKTNGSCRSCNDGFQGIKCDRDIRQSPTDFKKKMDLEDLKIEKVMLENKKTQKEIQRLEAETEVLRVRKNVLLRLQGILSELSKVVVQLLNDSKE